MDHEFNGTPEEVFAMFCDAASHVAKFESFGAENIEILNQSGDGISEEFLLEVAQDVTLDLPGFAKKMFSPTNRVTSIDKWRDNGDGTYGGGYIVNTPGVPISVEGTTALLPIDGHPDYTNFSVAVEIEVNVPVVGGKLAKWAKGNVEENMNDQFAAGDRWLAGER